MRQIKQQFDRNLLVLTVLWVGFGIISYKTLPHYTIDPMQTSENLYQPSGFNTSHLERWSSFDHQHPLIQS